MYDHETCLETCCKRSCHHLPKHCMSNTITNVTQPRILLAPCPSPTHPCGSYTARHWFLVPVFCEERMALFLAPQLLSAKAFGLKAVRTFQVRYSADMFAIMYQGTNYLAHALSDSTDCALDRLQLYSKTFFFACFQSVSQCSYCTP